MCNATLGLYKVFKRLEMSLVLIRTILHGGGPLLRTSRSPVPVTTGIHNKLSYRESMFLNVLEHEDHSGVYFHHTKILNFSSTLK